MKLLKPIVLAGGALIALASVANAADLPTKKGAPAPVKPNCYATFWTWLDSTPTECPLSYWGITFYGQVDLGAGYETHAAKANPSFSNVVQELISKQSHGAAWQLAPNGLSQSNIGIKWKEQILPNWYFIGDVNGGFDPYALRWADGPGSLEKNNNIPSFFQDANGDSSRTYGPINARAYAGIQNQTFGTLTYGRQYAFSNDVANSLYDPYGGAYAFSVIGNSSTIGGGLGDTELARYNNSIKYLYSDHNIRVGVMSEVGGWSAGNNAQYAIEGDVGFDWMGFSFDAVYEYAKDAVALSAFGGLPPAPLSTRDLKATIENESSFQLAGKYKWNQFTIYSGYEYQQITNPSDLPAGTQVADFNGGYPAEYGRTVQNSGAGFTIGAFPDAKVVQLLWVGGKYAVLPNLDLITAYYHVWQNNYLGSTQTFVGAGASCASNTSKDPFGNLLKGTNSSKCAGTEDAISGAVDWRPWKRVDVYAGAMYSKVSGGLANGFFADNNLAATGGVRFSF
jgi:predicted porin